MQANNGGDGNGDGIPDVLQSSVASRTNSVTGKSMTLASSNANCGVINSLAGIAESTLGAQDVRYDYPVGIFDYEINCTNPGDTTTVSIYLDQNYDTTDWVFRKFDANTNTYSTVSEVVKITPANEQINPTILANGIAKGSSVTSIVYDIQDGDSLDEDTAANAVIVDPAGPGLLVPGGKCH